MYVILGGTGHVGSSLAQRLLDKGERVMVVTRREQNRAVWEQRGAEVAVLDLRDAGSLRQVFRRGRRAFLLNPPADPGGDASADERVTARSIVAALEGAELQGVVALSTYGAQPGDAIADLGVLYDFEQALREHAVPTAVVRAAYYMSNWDGSLASVREQGQLPSFFPAEHELPMVAPADIAELASRLLTQAAEPSGLHYIEGPKRYTPGDVARAFASQLQRDVDVAVIPEGAWVDTLLSFGFSRASAISMAGMTRLVLHQRYETPGAPARGATTLEQYVRRLLQA